jgi:tetratricopeptide (TPR) repeat protein
MKTTVTLIALVALCGSAAAEKDKDKADALFRQGKKLMGEKRYADACQSFEQSFTLDPGIGVQLNVAKCYEEWGKLATAYRAYKKAEDLAKETHDSRVGKIHELADQLDTQVPKLTVHMPKNADTDDLKVWIDGAALEISALSEPQLVDPGPHLLEYQVGGAKKKSKVVPSERGGGSEVTLDVPQKTITKPDKPDRPDKPDIEVVKPLPDPGRTQKIAAYATGGAGVVMIGISTVLTLSARGKYNDALALNCGGMTNGCNAQGLKDTHDARSSANVATVVFLLGLGAVGGGVALYLTAPHAKKTASSDDEHALYIAPSLTSDGGGIVLGGNL